MVWNLLPIFLDYSRETTSVDQTLLYAVLKLNIFIFKNEFDKCAWCFDISDKINNEARSYINILLKYKLR